MINNIYLFFTLIFGDWGLGIGDWGLGVWAQNPKTKTPKPKPNPQKNKNFIKKLKF